MMSAAISMVAGLEQTKGRAGAGDLFSTQGAEEDVSFAKSLSESVGAAADSAEENDASGALSIVPPLQKDMTPAKGLGEAVENLSGGKEKFIAVHETAVSSELKAPIAGRIAPAQAPSIADAQGKITTSGSGTKVEVPPHAQVNVEDVSAEAPIPEDIPASAEIPAPQVDLSDGSQPLAPSVSSGDSHAVWTGTKTAEMVTEDVSLKKPSKAEEGAATQKTGQKPPRKIVNAISVGGKPATAISPESATAVVGQVAPAVVPTVTLQSEISRETEPAYRRGTSQAKLATGLSLAAVNDQARKDIASGAKPGVTNTASNLTAANDPVATAKTETSQQQTPAVSMPAGSDGENKPQAAGGNGAALLHSLGIVPTAGVSGSTPGELAPINIAAGDTARHLAGLPVGSPGQDGAGVAMQSSDGTPRMLAATPTSLEVGIQNGTHGWLKVRAEMTDGGVVNASISAATSAGQEMLHRELPALTAYLQQEKVAVNAVIVHPPSGAGADARSSSGADGAGGQTPQRNNEGEQQQQSVRRTTLNGSDRTVSYRGLHGFGEDGSLPLAAYVNGGTWLSVRA